MKLRDKIHAIIDNLDSPVILLGDMNAQLPQQQVLSANWYRQYGVPSASKVKKMHATLCFDAVFFQCCVQLFKSCVHFSKVACNFSKVACTFQKLRALFKSCVQLFKSQFSILLIYFTIFYSIAYCVFLYVFSLHFVEDE